MTQYFARCHTQGRADGVLGCWFTALPVLGVKGLYSFCDLLLSFSLSLSVSLQSLQ